MKRYTKNSLIADLEEMNKALEKNKLDYSFKYQHRNGYHAVDLYCGRNCLRNIDCNETPKILVSSVEDEFLNLMP